MLMDAFSSAPTRTQLPGGRRRNTKSLFCVHGISHPPPPPNVDSLEEGVGVPRCEILLREPPLPLTPTSSLHHILFFSLHDISTPKPPSFKMGLNTFTAAVLLVAGAIQVSSSGR